MQCNARCAREAGRRENRSREKKWLREEERRFGSYREVVCGIREVVRFVGCGTLVGRCGVVGVGGVPLRAHEGRMKNGPGCGGKHDEL